MNRNDTPTRRISDPVIAGLVQNVSNLNKRVDELRDNIVHDYDMISKKLDKVNNFYDKLSDKADNKEIDILKIKDKELEIAIGKHKTFWTVLLFFFHPAWLALIYIILTRK